MNNLRPEADDPRERSNLVAGAVILVLLIVGAAFAVWALSGGLTRRGGATYSLFLPGASPLEPGAEVLLNSRHIGEVERSEPPRPGLALLVTQGTVPEISEMATLFPGGEVQLADPDAGSPVVLTMPSPTQVTIAAGGSRYVLDREAANRWRVDPSGASTALVVNGAEVKRSGLTLATGDVLALGRVRIEWQDVGEVSRVVLRLSARQARGAAKLPDSTSAGFLFGPRSAVQVANPFGLGKPALKLTPAYGRPAFVLRPDTVLGASPAVDLERAVQGMLAYLNSPGALRREPSTRFERIVSDLNGTLDQAQRAGTQVNTVLAQVRKVSEEDGGRGMVGKLVLSRRALDSLDRVASNLAVFTAPFADTGRSMLSRLRLAAVDSSIVRLSDSATATMHRVDGVVASLKSALDTLRPALAKVGPTIDAAKSALDNANTGITGAKKLGPVVGISGIAVSLVGILKMLGVF